jgi:hypothetical protein
VAYTVSAAAGQRLFFESLSSFSWQLYDRSGRVVARGTGNDNDFTFTSPQADEYALVLEGSSNSPVTVNFRIATPDPTTTPLTLGTTVSGSLAEPGEIDEYTFQGTPGQQLFDSQPRPTAGAADRSVGSAVFGPSGVSRRERTLPPQQAGRTALGDRARGLRSRVGTIPA